MSKTLKANPVDFMINRTGLSRLEMTLKHGFGKNLLLRISQGRAQAVTPRIESALWAEWERLGISQDEFDDKYGTLSVAAAFDQWVKDARYSRRGTLPVKVEHDPQASPFARLVRAIGSTSQAAKTLCVADIPVQRYAAGEGQRMPVSIREALDGLGYPYTEQLESAQKVWKGQNA